MKVLVTGGSGRLGRWVVSSLSQQGWEVLSVDRSPPPVDDHTSPAVSYRTIDLVKTDELAMLLRDCDAVVHLAAIPSPGKNPDDVVFVNNTRATFAVLNAASQAGVRKAIVASSVSALGMAWAATPFPPRYVPIDEEHPAEPADPYGLSKLVDEQTCAMFHRATGMSVLAYRFHTVLLPGEAWQGAQRAPAEDQRHIRHQWGYVDVRDAAEACRLGLISVGLGYEVLNIVAADALSERPTKELLDLYLPDVPRVKLLVDSEGVWSIEKARALIGYQPVHGWRAQRP